MLTIQRHHVTVNPHQISISSPETWHFTVTNICEVWNLVLLFAFPATFSAHADIYRVHIYSHMYYKKVLLVELLVSRILPLCVILFSYVMTVRHIMKSALPISSSKRTQKYSRDCVRVYYNFRTYLCVISHIMSLYNFGRLSSQKGSMDHMFCFSMPTRI